MTLRRLSPSASGAPASTARTVANAIRRDIYEGRITDGQRLREEQLAADLGVSRTPIREALLILQTEGVVEAAPNRGSVVREFTVDEVIDHFRVHAMLAAYAAALAAPRITDEQIAALRESREQLAKVVDSESPTPVIEAEMRFQEIIREASGNAALLRIVQSTLELPLVHHLYGWDTPETRRNILSHQAKVIDALRRRDPYDAETRMRALALDVLDVVESHRED